MTASIADAGPVPVQDPGRVGVAVLLFCSMMTVMAGATISPSLPQMVLAFQDTPDAGILVRLVITITSLAIALTAMPVGALADRIGRIPLLTGGIALYVAAGTAGLWVDQLGALLASRVALGMAVAAIMTTATALIGDYFDGERRGRILGWQGSAMGFGGVVFITLGGLLAQTGWRGPFWVYAIPIVLLAAVPLILHEPARLRPGTPGQSAGREPQGPRFLLYAAAFLVMAGFYAVPVQMPFLLAEQGHPEPRVAGLALGTVTLVSALASLNFGAVTRRLRPGLVVPLATAAAGAGVLIAGLAPALPLTFAGLALTGLGLGLTMPGLPSFLMRITPRARMGRVMGGFTTAIFLGQFASPLLLQPAIARAGTAAGVASAAVLFAAAAALLRLIALRYRVAQAAAR
ncbi:MFS transporter [Rhodobacteraceae bacterium 2CG4]|uniref:MFS transporter n=1 Tax=Halovulum marinum TaxID=2662447 RepID=A0A6L5Z3I2_9RHOB|nr:MFS transporter [Halovulum marinum]MSU91133.1 MFS transporter [Halovulum marinum]